MAHGHVSDTVSHLKACCKFVTTTESIRLVQTDGLGKPTVSETPCQRERTTADRLHPGLPTCEDAHSMLVVRLSLLVSSSCERLQATCDGESTTDRQHQGLFPQL